MEKDNFLNLFNDIILEVYPDAFDDEIELREVKKEKLDWFLPRTHGERVIYQETNWYR